jgi:hypothetical protein
MPQPRIATPLARFRKDSIANTWGEGCTALYDICRNRDVIRQISRIQVRILPAFATKVYLINLFEFLHVKYLCVAYSPEELPHVTSIISPRSVLLATQVTRPALVESFQELTPLKISRINWIQYTLVYALSLVCNWPKIRNHEIPHVHSRALPDLGSWTRKFVNSTSSPHLSLSILTFKIKLLQVYGDRPGKGASLEKASCRINSHCGRRFGIVFLIHVQLSCTFHKYFRTFTFLLHAFPNQ